MAEGLLLLARPCCHDDGGLIQPLVVQEAVSPAAQHLMEGFYREACGKLLERAQQLLQETTLTELVQQAKQHHEVAEVSIKNCTGCGHQYHRGQYGKEFPAKCKGATVGARANCSAKLESIEEARKRMQVAQEGKHSQFT